ncbi:hypothetical protein [Paenibacillus elgii]|uniref:hypothetical protein n=1 Tax=Paenibacillus elgii TaxID=189691 RepID=UPI0013D5F8C0|nr:hypothetical protein [Paenibacillus elgii]
MTYESLLIEAAHHGVDTYEIPMTSGNKGLYSDKVIWINKCMPTKVEKTCVLSVEFVLNELFSCQILLHRVELNLKIIDPHIVLIVSHQIPRICELVRDERRCWRAGSSNPPYATGMPSDFKAWNNSACDMISLRSG